MTGLGAATPVLIPTNGTTEANIQEDQNYTILALSLFEDDAEELTGSSIMLVRLPEVGQALVDQLTGNIIYTSNPNDYGTRSLSFRACNSVNNCSSEVNFTIIIDPVNDLPYPVPPLLVEVDEDNEVAVDLRRFFADIEDDEVSNSSYPTVSNLSGGNLGNWNRSGVFFQYSPAPNTAYNDSFDFTVCDSDNACINLTFTIVVEAVNDPPVISYQYPTISPTSFVTLEDTAITFPINILDIEDNSTVTINVVNSSNGTLTITNATYPVGYSSETGFNHTYEVQYQPDINFFGEDTVTVSATDSEGGYSVANISIFVEYVNDPPVFGIVNITILEDTILRLRLPDDLQVVDPEDELNAASFSIVFPPEYGELSYASILRYSSPLNYYTLPNQPLTFVLMACDDNSISPFERLCVNQTIRLTITPDLERSEGAVYPVIPNFDGE